MQRISSVLALVGIYLFLLSPRTLGNVLEPVTFQALKSDILTNDIRSSEMLLRYFAQTPKYAAFVRSPVLERESDALHGDDVTPELPRIIMHADNVTMHLIGDPRQRGVELVEIAEYVPSSGRFEFSVINFALWGQNEMFLEDIEFKTKIDSRTQALYNGTIGQFISCAACHLAAGNSLLPMWNPLSSLHRSYGTVNDRIGSRGVDREGFEKFLVTRDDPHLGKLYRHLDISFSNDRGDIVFDRLPNKSLTSHIYGNVRSRIAKQIHDAPEYMDIQYALIGALFDCDNVEQYFPQDFRAQHERTLLAAIEEQGLDSVPVSMLDTTKLRGGYEAHVEVSRGNVAFLLPAGTHFLTEPHLLMYTKEQFPEALRHLVQRTNSILGFFTSRRMPLEVLGSAGRLIEDDFNSPRYISIVAKLRYLLDGILPLGFSAANEIDFHHGHPHKSYRFHNGLEGLMLLSSENLGPRFLQDNPDLNRFNNAVVDPAALTVPRQEYCQLLQDKSNSHVKLLTDLK